MVKDTHEVLVLAKLLGKTAKDVMADGKVSATDLPKLIPLWGPTKTALEGLQNIPGELNFGKLTQAEVEMLISDIVEVVQIWMSVIGEAVTVPKAA